MTSVVFDPLMYLSLPLPAVTERVINVLVVPMSPERRPRQYGVKVCPLSAVCLFVCVSL